MIRITPADVIRPPSFTPIHILEGEGVALQTMQGRLGTRDPVQLTLVGSGLRNYYEAILAITAGDIANGRPRRSLSGFTDATADVGAQLVTLEVKEGAWSSGFGILSSLGTTVGPGSHLINQFDLIFYPCHTLWYYGLTEAERQSVTHA